MGLPADGEPSAAAQTIRKTRVTRNSHTGFLLLNVDQRTDAETLATDIGNKLGILLLQPLRILVQLDLTGSLVGDATVQRSSGTCFQAQATAAIDGIGTSLLGAALTGFQLCGSDEAAEPTAAALIGDG